MSDAKPLELAPADPAAVQDARQFVAYRLSYPSDPLVKELDGLLANGDQNGVNAFFARASSYPNCTFSAYMLALADRARNPPQPSQAPASPERQTYSLSMLCRLLGGGSWPPELPDVSVSNPSFTTANGVVAVAGTINLGQVTFQSLAVASNIASFLPLNEVQASCQFNTTVGFQLFATSISFTAGDFHIPLGQTTLTLAKPTVRLDLTPAFRSFAFTASTTIPFKIFGKRFDADVSFVVDNTEAEVGVVVRGDTSSLPSPPGVKGLHLDAFGVGMGIIFQPGSYALGIEGKFHIGDGASVVVNQDNFVLVCSLVDGEVPNPVYIAFYLTAVDFPTLVEVFTDQKVQLDFPVTLQDLAFQWAENPMGRVVLPDGTLSPKGFGCRGSLHVLGFQFYGAFVLSLAGVEATLTTSPVVFGSVLRLAGQGGGFSVKVDGNGNPIDNTQLPKTEAVSQIIAAAPFHELVAPGGPELIVSTTSEPKFRLTASVSLFECQAQIDAVVAGDGIKFQMGFGSVISGDMSCCLVNGGRFQGEFSFTRKGISGIDLPTINGYSLGSVVALFNVSASIELHVMNTGFTVDASFTMGGLGLQVVRITCSPDMTTLQQVVDAVIDQIRQDAGSLFVPIVTNGLAWARAVIGWNIEQVTNTAEGLSTVFGKSMDESASIMNNVGYTLDTALRCLPPVYNPTAEDLTSALKSGYGATDDLIASKLRGLNYDAAKVANAIAQVFGRTPDEVNSVLQQAGYPASQIQGAFQTMGGDFQSAGERIWGTAQDIPGKVLDTVTDKFNPASW